MNLVPVQKLFSSRAWAGALVSLVCLCISGAAVAWTGPASSPPNCPAGSPGCTIPGAVLTRICVMTPTSNNCGTSGPTGTYTPSANTVYSTVEVWGAGGGGGGAGNGSPGSNGGTTCFGTNSSACTSPLLSATGGNGANAAYNPGDGGVGSCGSDASNCLTLSGGGGGGVITIAVGAAQYYYASGSSGGSAARGGGGGAAHVWGPATGGSFGGGGAGGYMYPTNSSYWPGAGGGGGGYAQKLLTAPSSTYYYSIGSGGAGGAPGSCGGCAASSAGASGGPGGIIIYEYTGGGVGSGGSGGVSQITAGNGISISPTGGTGNVTISTGIRSIAHASANGPVDGTDSGQIASRVLTFTKQLSSTQIRIGYTDNMRAYVGNNVAGCRWELRVNGQSCQQPLVYDVYSGGASHNPHHNRTAIGYCKGVSAGTHTIGVWVSNTIAGVASDCYTGWSDQTWTLEAEEVSP